MNAPFAAGCSVLSAALALVDMSLAVFPCRADNKRPATPRGHKDASRDPEIVATMFRDRPLCLIGVPTGDVNSFDVLDIDPRNGGDTWLAAHRHKLPVTRTHHTRSGGRHFFFQHAAGMFCREGRPAPGVDVRASGGYVIWWPAAGFPVENESVAPWPAWLLEILIPPPPPPRKPYAAPTLPGTSVAQRYAVAALKSACERVAMAPAGSNPSRELNREAHSLARFIAAGDLPRGLVVDRLTAAATAAGLPLKDIARTLDKAIAAGMAKA